MLNDETLHHSPRRVLSMILKLLTLLRKSDARGAYGFLRCSGFLAVPLTPFAWPFTPFVWTDEECDVEPFVMSTATISEVPFGSESPLACGHMAGFLM